MNTKRRIGSAGQPDSGEDVTHLVPRALRVSAALSWRFLVVIGALGIIVWGLGYLAIVTIPVGIALLLAALFTPIVMRLVQWKVPRALATAIAVIFGLAVIGGVLTLVITQIVAGFPQLQSQVGQSLDTINDWLRRGPLHLRHDQLQSLLNNAVNTIKGNASELTSRALTTAAAVGEGLTGALLTLFTLIFFLYGGESIWQFLVKIIPADVRSRVDVAGRRGFTSLVSYVRATIAVAFVDAAGIGIGLWIVGIPLVIPLAALVFLGAFVPIIGAVIAGTVAVLVALVAKGFIAALIVLAILIGVMQLEGHVLQPLLLGRAVRLHPLAVVLAIAVGLVIAGIAGALLAVPILSLVNSGVRSLIHDPELSPASVDVLESKNARPTTDPKGPDTSDTAETGRATGEP